MIYFPANPADISAMKEYQNRTNSSILETTEECTKKIEFLNQSLQRNNVNQTNITVNLISS